MVRGILVAALYLCGSCTLFFSESAAGAVSHESHQPHGGADPHHHHGDSDDRHSSPDSPCEHQPDHCHCSQSPPSPAIPPDPSRGSEITVSRVPSFHAHPSVRPSLTSILHVPIA